jgi:hypothetical protein
MDARKVQVPNVRALSGVTGDLVMSLESLPDGPL